MSQKQYAYFSAAIRDGAQIRPQAFWGFFRDGGSCAVGAGLEVCEIKPRESCLIPQKLWRAFPYLQKGVFACPDEGCDDLDMKLNEWSAVSIMAHLNDTHKWTREAIADWLFLEEEKLGFITLTEDSTSSVIQPYEREPKEVCSALSQSV